MSTIGRDASIALLLGLLALPVGARELLTGDQIQLLLPGSTGRFVSEYGRDVVMKFLDGTFTMDIPEASYSDHGKWWIKGNNWCREFVGSTRAGAACHDIYKLEDGEYLFVRHQDKGTNTVRITKE